MTYPGDSSLSPEIQQRILTTYRQTLHLASQGNRQEALLGCDFILRLDARFNPARALQQMLQAGSPKEAYAGLLSALPDPAPPPAPVPGFDGLSDLRLEVGPGGAPGGAPADLGARLRQLLEERRFQELVAAADSERRTIATDPALRQIVETARARQEAEPYLLGFMDPARQALQAGEFDEFDRLMRKAKALDSSHPMLAELEEARRHYQDPERMIGARRRVAAAAEAAETGGFAAAGGAQETGYDLPELDLDAPAAASEGFDLGEGVPPAGGGASDSEGRIAELLRDGEGAFARGEYQAAIDAWSRIFLIDIDHQEAARRIEQARQLKAEREREIEELFHDTVERFDNGDLAGAQEGFERVLSLQRGHLLAQEYLEKIEERRRGGAASVAASEAPATAAPLAGARAAPTRPAAREELSEEILVPPEPGQVRPARRGATPSGMALAAKRRGDLLPRFFVIGGAVLVLLALAGWFVTSRWDRLFPNANAVATPAPAQTDPIARARKLHEDGKTAVAIAQLRRIPPDDARYGEAQSLVSQWEAIAQDAADRPALSEAQAFRRRALIDGARESLEGQNNVMARSRLERAGEIAPLTGEEAELAATAQERLGSFSQELQYFKDGEYEFLLNALWRRREAEKGDRDLDQLIVNAYYNLAVLDLQRGDPGAALEKLKEARKIDTQDPVLERLERFAAVYERRSEDLLYRIFVKYLSMR